MPEHTIAENLTRLQNATTAIGNAITAKGGTVTSGDGLEDFASDIASIPSGGGGGGSSNDDVRFIDYDGTIVQSYSAADFANLSAMPANPTHEGLTAQGWNWTLADAKTYVAANGKLDIGQMYVTSDGKTRLYINLLDDYKSPTLELYLNTNSEVDVDWGDGSSHSTLSSTSAGYQSETHTYAVSGDYIIAITVVGGSIEIYGNSGSFSLLKGNDSTTNTNYRESLFNIEIGSSATSIGNNAFQNCFSLTSITIPSTVTSIGNPFYSCYSLKSITIPLGITSIVNYAFQNCSSLKSITIPSTVTSIGSGAFQTCSSLTSITIPSSVTSIGSGVFNNCSSLTSITIPSSVTSIGDAFQSCYSLTSVTIPSSVTSIGSVAFSSCYSLLYIYLRGDLLTGSPWDAPNTHVKVRSLKHNNYTSAVNEVSSGTTLTTSVSCTVGDLVIATFAIRGNTYSLSEGWSLIGISDVVGNLNQRTGLAYKTATSTTESLTVTQDSSARIYTNLVAITGASIGTFSGFTTQSTGYSITMNRPNGLVLWAVSSSLWGTVTPYQPWGISNIDDITAIELPTTTQPRCLTALDQSNDSTVTFRYSPDVSGDAGLAAASLTITGIDNFWYYDEPQT